jgi:polyhydroxyalkanoate synthesis regulator phasin
MIPDGKLKQFICKNIDKQGIKGDISKCVKVILGLTSGDKDTVIEHLNNLVDKSQVLSDKSISDNSELIKSLAETIAELSGILEENIRNRIESLDVFKKECTSKINELENRVTKLEGTAKEQSNQIEDLNETVTAHGDELDKISAKSKRQKIAIICISAIVLVLAIVWITARNNYGDWFSGNDITVQLSHICGNKDIAYNYAVEQETNKQYEVAAKWYKKAIDRYTSLVDNNPEGEQHRAELLTFMYMRGKGGLIDNEKAIKYADIAKRPDIMAYLYTYDDKFSKAKSILNIVGNSMEESDFAKLAKIKIYLSQTSNNSEAKKLINELLQIESKSREAKEEALLYESTLHREGVIEHNPLRVLFGPDFYSAFADLIEASEIYNSLRAQLRLASDLKFLIPGSAIFYFDKAYRNGNRTELIGSYYNLLEHCKKEFVDSLGYFDDIKYIYLKNFDRSKYDVATTLSKNIESGNIQTSDIMNELSNLSSEIDNIEDARFYAIIRAKDITQPEQIYDYISDKYKDKKFAIANYYMAARYWYNMNTWSDTSAIDSCMKYLNVSCEAGLDDAKVLRAAISVDRDNDCKQSVLNELDSLRNDPTAELYLIKYGEMSESSRINKLHQFVNDNPYYAYGLCLYIEMIRDKNLSEFEITQLIHLIKLALTKAYHIQTPRQCTGYLLGCLAELEYRIKYCDLCRFQFYIAIAESLLSDDPGILGDSYFYISEAYRTKNNNDYAYLWMAKFLDIFSNIKKLPSDALTYAAIYSHCKKYYPKLMAKMPYPEAPTALNGTTYKGHLDSMFGISVVTFTSKYLK